jgi:arsenite methyltransferase
MTADYGIDAPKEQKAFLWRGVTFLALGLGIYLMNRREYPGPAGSILAVLGLISVGFFAISAFMRWSSLTGKLSLRDDILKGLDLKGEEKVLDVGCGRGLLLIGAAKLLNTKGRATGIDCWHDDLTKNSKEETNALVKAEGVADRVRVETGDATALPFGDASFDAVVSSTCIHNLADANDRAKAIAEIYRVTKPGGRIAIYDILRYGEYAKSLRGLGAGDVAESGMMFYWAVPGKIVRARKAG